MGCQDWFIASVRLLQKTWISGRELRAVMKSGNRTTYSPVARSRTQREILRRYVGLCPDVFDAPRVLRHWVITRN